MPLSRGSIKRASTLYPRVLRAIKAALVLVAVACPVAAQELAFVTNQNSGDVSIIDLDALKEIARVDVAGSPAGVDVTSGAAYIVSPDTHSVTKLRLSDGAPQAQIELPGGPIGIATTPQRVFVTDFYNSRFWVIDADLTQVLDERLTSSAPAGIAVSVRHNLLVTADRDADAVSLFDLTTLDLRATVKVGTRPFAVTIDETSGLVFAANVGSDSVSVIAPETASIIETIPSGNRPYGVAFAGDKGFVTDQYADTITVFDRNTYKVLEKLGSSEYPEGVNPSLNGDRIIVANWFSNTLSVFDAKTHELIAEIETGDGPRAFGKFIARLEN